MARFWVLNGRILYEICFLCPVRNADCVFLACGGDGLPPGERGYCSCHGVRPSRIAAGDARGRA
ncbi:MAG: hypothetical protein B7X93_11185, partial [Hydrogenophilales bacterium 17-61-9]